MKSVSSDGDMAIVELAKVKTPKVKARIPVCICTVSIENTVRNEATGIWRELNPYMGMGSQVLCTMTIYDHAGFRGSQCGKS
jgi:hypothetical protein